MIRPARCAVTKNAKLHSVDIAGLNRALDNALEIENEFETTEIAESAEFNRILSVDGTKAAVVWRACQMPSS